MSRSGHEKGRAQERGRHRRWDGEETEAFLFYRIHAPELPATNPLSHFLFCWQMLPPPLDSAASHSPSPRDVSPTIQFCAVPYQHSLPLLSAPIQPENQYARLLTLIISFPCS